MPLTVGSLFSGIGGFDLSLHLADLDIRWQCEINKRCCRVLAHHWPEVDRYGDVTQFFPDERHQVDLIVGGFPCQDLSVCGQREGLQGNRSGLFFEMMRIVETLKPTYVLWENVPGLLTGFDEVEVEDGECKRCGWAGWTHNLKRNRRDNPCCGQCGRGVVRRRARVIQRPWMLTLLSELHRIGFDGAWTTFDARWFGLAQQRRRVFGLFARRDARCARPGEVLSFSNRLFRNTRKISREEAFDSGAIAKRGYKLGETVRGSRQVAKGAEEFCESSTKPTGSFLAFEQNQRDEVRLCELSGACKAQPGMKNQTFVLHGKPSTSIASTTEVASCLVTRPGQLGTTTNIVTDGFCIRKFTPTECLRLQGFPDDWLDLDPPLSDNCKYEGIGNAVPVPVAFWIAQQLVKFHESEDSK